MNYLRRVWETRSSTLWLALIRILVGFEWLRSGWEKVVDPEFAAGLPNTLGFFASQNPNAWYVSLINNIALPNVRLFAILVAYGEFLVGLSLLLGLFTYVGAFFAMVMNANYFFATSHLSPSNYGLNFVLFIVTFILILGGACKVLSLDQVLSEGLLRFLPWSRLCRAQPDVK